MPPAPMVAEMVRQFHSRLDWPEGRLDRISISSSLAPTTDDRRMLGIRRDEILAGLTSARSEAIGRLVASLRAVMPAQDGGDAVLVVKLYMAALSKYPEWAINAACRAFLEGRVPGQRRFAPTPAEIADRCRAMVAPFEQEMAQIDRVLRAEVREPVTQEGRERIAQGLRDLAAKIGRESAAEEEERCAAARKSLAEMNDRMRQRELDAHGIDDGLTMSFSLRKQLGLAPQPKASDDE